MTPPEISRELLEKFEKGLCTEAEYQTVLTWIRTADKTQAHAEFLEKYWQRPQDNIPEPDYQEIFDKINASIQDSPKIRDINWGKQWLWVAAVFLGFLVCGLVYWQFSQNQLITYQTAFGQHQSIVLPDNSVVELNGNSKIAYKANWQENKVREVWLDGEGFFSVQHLKNHQKFIVHTQKKLAIEVLGTQFNVLARPSGTQVMLRSGKIRLNIPETKSVIMKPGELVQFQEKPAAYTKAVVNPAAYSAWKENKFSLNNTSLKQILIRLEETYGVKIQVSNPNLLRLKGSGTMPADNLETLLQVIAETFELKVNQKNPNYFLLEPADTLE